MWTSSLVLLFTFYVFCVTQSWAIGEENYDYARRESYKQAIKKNHAEQCSVKTYCPEGHHCCTAATCCPDEVDCCGDGLYCCDSDEAPPLPSIKAVRAGD